MEGVFRKPGNSKSMREIREQLNAGLPVNMEELPVVLLVALLKVHTLTSAAPFSSTAATHFLYSSWYYRCVCFHTAGIIMIVLSIRMHYVEYSGLAGSTGVTFFFSFPHHCSVF